MDIKLIAIKVATVLVDGVGVDLEVVASGKGTGHVHGEAGTGQEGAVHLQVACAGTQVDTGDQGAGGGSAG